MRSQRVTDLDISLALLNTTRLMRDAGVTDPINLYVGARQPARETNKLIVGKVNIWNDGKAGFTKREAYNALRLMSATLGAVADAKDF